MSKTQVGSKLLQKKLLKGRPSVIQVQFQRFSGRIFAVRSGRPGARIFLQDSSLSCRILCATCWGLRLGSLLYEATSLSPLSP